MIKKLVFTIFISFGLFKQVERVLPLTGGIGATGGGFWHLSENLGTVIRVEFATGAIVT